MRPRIIFFDIETRKWAKDLNPEDPEMGWEDLRHGKGGASAICLYDTADNWLYTYDDFRPELAIQHLEEADLVVGYCSDQFDIPCIEGLAGRRLRQNATFDILVALQGTVADRGMRGLRGDLTLDRISRQNLGRGKINHGSNARELARLGRFGELFNYCGDDVHLTRDLFVKLCRDGGLINLGGKFTSISIPARWREWGCSLDL